MSHHDLALERTNRLKRNADDDQHCRTAERYLREARVYPRENDREYRDNSEENSADKRYLVQGIVDEVRRGLARTITGNSAVVLLQVVCYLHGIIGDRHIEVVEAQNQQEVEDSVCGRGVCEKSHEALPEIVTACSVSSYSEEEADSLRKRHKRHREDDRHYAAHRYLYRNMRGLSAVHLPSDNALRVLHGNSPFRVRHKDNEPDHRNKDYNGYQHKHDILAEVFFIGGKNRRERADRLRKSRYDTREEYH